MFIPNVTPATLVTPATTVNDRNNTVYHYDGTATRTPITGWLQQRGVQSVGSARNSIDNGRTAGDSTWVFYTNQAGVTRFSHIEFGGKVYSVDGEPYPTRSLSPGIDHYEINLSLVEG